MSDYKTCKKCDVEKPASVNYFYLHPKSKDGLLNVCIDCKKSLSKRQWETIKSSPLLHQREIERQRDKNNNRPGKHSL